MRAAVVISADAEWRAFKECLPDLHIEPSPYGQQAQINLGSSKIPVLHGGWGKISAAASAQYIIDQYQPDLLVNLGTCGGFAGRVETGTILLVERTLIYDILEQMGDAEAALEHYATRLDLSWLPAELPYPVRRGLLISADRDLPTGRPRSSSSGSAAS